MIPPICTVCIFVVLKLRESDSLIWWCHDRGKKDLSIKFGPVDKASKLATVQSEFIRKPMEIRNQYLGWWKKEPTPCGFSSYAMPAVYGAFNGGSWILVVRTSQVALPTLLFLRGAAVLWSVIVMATTLVALTFVDLLWQMSSRLRSKTLKGPAVCRLFTVSWLCMGDLFQQGFADSGLACCNQPRHRRRRGRRILPTCRFLGPS